MPFNQLINTIDLLISDVRTTKAFGNFMTGRQTMAEGGCDSQKERAFHKLFVDLKHLDSTIQHLDRSHQHSIGERQAEHDFEARWQFVELWQ